MSHHELRDAWLFLTPEVEREVAGLIGRLGGDQDAVAAQVDELVRLGDARAWFACLRERRAELEAAIAAGEDRAAAHRLALVLREQYLLAPGVPGLTAQDERELRRLQEIIEEREPAWTSR